MLILKNTTLKSGQIFQPGRRKQDGTLECGNDTTPAQRKPTRWFYQRATGSYNTLLAREGKTPATLKKLKESIPNARKISKTDLAKYLYSWSQKPRTVALGSQKNFAEMMKEVENGNLTT